MINIIRYSTNYSCFEGLEYSDSVTSDEAVEDIELLALAPLPKLFDASAGFLCGPLAVEAAAPSSANLFIMFMIVGTNLVDKERRPGSCSHSIKQLQVNH